ncbi:hypothetical protein FS749_007302 [Ceratobasidium sp. UAMH 11750]|nr:hypothetical protein FS749_007302 [Ceratobasidium sp. UAMH 11750]
MSAPEPAREDHGVRDRVPREHKGRANDQIDRARDFLRGGFPEERREQFIYRLKKAMVKCQNYGGYQQSLNWLLTVVETHHGHSKTPASIGQDSAKNISGGPFLQLITSELHTLLERFVNGRSMNPTLDHTGQLWDDAQKGVDIRNWFRKLDDYVRRVLLVLQLQCNSRGNEIREEDRSFFDEKYQGHKENLFESI